MIRRARNDKSIHDWPTHHSPHQTNMILLIDNYDSFTYNLVQRLGELDPNIELQVYRNDKIDADQVTQLQPSHIIISPAPCTPLVAGVSNQIIERFTPT